MPLARVGLPRPQLAAVAARAGEKCDARRGARMFYLESDGGAYVTR
jgi:hypothetical protein